MRVLDLETFANTSGTHCSSGNYRPLFLKLKSDDIKTFYEICKTRGIIAFDTINHQLDDLAAVRFPSEDLIQPQRWVEEQMQIYKGHWVYLPWEQKVFRLLEPDDYFELITNRNRDKITLEEQQSLRTKCVGIMGLSVGGEAAVTIAQEHLCGHIVLADHDQLDLSNLNRLNAGFDELGENKAVLVARRIAKIDPYLKVTVYQEGVTDNNVDSFLDDLDLLVEECDHLPIKFSIRTKAIQRRLNVIFAGDERGFLSVEPYGAYSGLEPFHGRINSQPLPKNGFRSAREFWKALTEWLGGWDAISERSRNSLNAIGTSLVGYPQLASEARFAAGQVGHVARRLLLDENLSPFFGQIDLEDLLPVSRINV